MARNTFARRRAWVCGLCLLVFTATVAAQGRSSRRSLSRTGAAARDNHSLRKVLAPVVAKARPATVWVYCDGEQVAFGTVVDKAGVLVTKASELDVKRKLEIELAGKRVTAKWLGSDETNDLAVLRVEAKGLTAVALLPAKPAVSSAPVAPVKPGNFVVTASPRELPLAWGVVSVAAHSRKGRTFLGVQSQAVDNGIELTRIVPDTAAAAAGLQAGDVVTKVDGKDVRSRLDFVTAITSHQPGDDLHLEIRRGEEVLAIVAHLRKDKNRHGPISSQERQRLWGPLSEVRVGFDEVIQHDTVIRPEHCGGPLVDLQGRVVGINIARVGRFESVALSAKVVRQCLDRVLEQAK